MSRFTDPATVRPEDLVSVGTHVMYEERRGRKPQPVEVEMLADPHRLKDVLMVRYPSGVVSRLPQPTQTDEVESIGTFVRRPRTLSTNTGDTVERFEMAPTQVAVLEMVSPESVRVLQRMYGGAR